MRIVTLARSPQVDQGQELHAPPRTWPSLILLSLAKLLSHLTLSLRSLQRIQQEHVPHRFQMEASNHEGSVISVRYLLREALHLFRSRQQLRG